MAADLQPARRVLVTGIGVVTPIGIGLDAFWRACSSGENGIGPITLMEVSDYDCRIAGEVKDFDPERHMDRKLARRAARFIQFGLAAARLAKEDAGLDFDGVNAERVGVFVGSGIGGIDRLEAEHEVILERGPSRCSPFLVPMMIPDMAAGLISIDLGTKGPNSCVVTACATGTHSIGDAYHVVRRGEADVMLAGGSEAPISKCGLAGFCAAKAVSTRNDDPAHASRPFDRDRDGFLMAEGAGILVLEAEEHAIRRGAKVYGEIIGYGMSGDAFHITQPDPDGNGAFRAMRAALHSAGIGPEEVDYINAHGTSTQLNDKLETAAIKSLFGDHAHKLAVSSTKSMVGHLLGAAGAVEAAATLMAIQTNLLPPTINYEVPDPECDLDYVPNTARDARVNVAMSNSFGFGGHNASILMRRYAK